MNERALTRRGRRRREQASAGVQARAPPLLHHGLRQHHHCDIPDYRTRGCHLLRGPRAAHRRGQAPLHARLSWLRASRKSRGSISALLPPLHQAGPAPGTHHEPDSARTADAAAAVRAALPPPRTSSRTTPRSPHSSTHHAPPPRRARRQPWRPGERSACTRTPRRARRRCRRARSASRRSGSGALPRRRARTSSTPRAPRAGSRTAGAAARRAGRGLTHAPCAACAARGAGLEGVLRRRGAAGAVWRALARAFVNRVSSLAARDAAARWRGGFDVSLIAQGGADCLDCCFMYDRHCALLIIQLTPGRTGKIHTSLWTALRSTLHVHTERGPKVPTVPALLSRLPPITCYCCVGCLAVTCTHVFGGNATLSQVVFLYDTC